MVAQAVTSCSSRAHPVHVGALARHAAQIPKQSTSAAALRDAHLAAFSVSSRSCSRSRSWPTWRTVLVSISTRTTRSAAAGQNDTGAVGNARRWQNSHEHGVPDNQRQLPAMSAVQVVFGMCGGEPCKARRTGAGPWGLCTFVDGCHTLIDLVDQAACQVLDVSTPLLSLLPAPANRQGSCSQPVPALARAACRVLPAGQHSTAHASGGPCSLDDAVQVLHCAREALKAAFEGARQLCIVAVHALLHRGTCTAATRSFNNSGKHMHVTGSRQWGFACVWRHIQCRQGSA